ncbi:Uncharacterized lipoprotein MPN_097 precursor [Mesomycoplasma dispar]|uniref:Uncharacterized lipoprotein MPN_097 n=1 Tax=Mesomycoplasma dispar TaxID=86660 RepID=A0AAJ5NQG2_9BACT|nr:P80 family lipoprotein [Mesomycoplasma dispar]AJR12591.1 hypothetical protein MDIS_03250 [Mesomycoplasma dispar]VEU62250.1 Uncharacterized lipoprotein MPN_097 precursor [Mesomycoplasma dispar]
MKTKFKQLKKLLIFPVASFSTLILTSCGLGHQKKFSFDGNYDGKLQMVTSWTAEQARFQALKQIVEIWNNKPEVQDMKNREFLPIELTPSYDVDYAPMATKFSQIFSAKDKAQTLNLVLNFPPAAAVAAKYKMLLNLAEFPDLADAIKKVYHPKFLETSKQIATLDEKGIYSLPFVKSSQTIAINAPVMAWIIENALKNGAKIKKGEEEFFSQFRKSKTDLVQIQKLWKPIEFTKANNPWSNFEFSQDIFKYFDQLFDFVLKIKAGFNLNPAKIDSAYFPFGFDDIPNLIFSKIFAATGADYSKFLFEVAKGDSKLLEQVSFSKLFEKNSPTYKIAKKNYEQILELFKSDAIFYPGRFSEPSFANLFMNHHQIAMAISSTSNYERRFTRAKSNFVFEINKSTKKIPLNSAVQIYEILPLNSFGFKPKNSIFQLKQVLTNQLSHLINDTKKTKYPESNVYIDAKKFDLVAKINDAINSKSKNSDQSIYLAIDPEIAKYYQENISKIDSENIINLTKNNNSNDIFLIKSGFIENINGEKLLNENEIIFLQEPVKNSKNELKNVFTYQGPDLIAFHSNDEEDIATKNFLKWILTHKQEFTYKNAGKEAKYFGSPNEFVAFRGNYLAPTKANFRESLTNKSKFRQNNAFRVAFTNFKQVNDDPENSVFYIDPIDSRSSLIREVILSSLNQMGRLVIDGSPEKANFDNFLASLRTNLFTIKVG